MKLSEKYLQDQYQHLHRRNHRSNGYLALVFHCVQFLYVVEVP